MEVKHSI